jgi:tRNA pseudouridine55 synthase
MIHGLVAVKKAKGCSSHDVVRDLRRLLHIKKVGHFGTLDPNATGLLLIGLGNATKLFDFYKEKEKVYQGLVRFGHATTTYDSEGEAVGETLPVDLTVIDLQPVLARFVGTITQIPPVYSAKKYKGKPLYKYARQNLEAPVKPITITIHDLQLGRVTADTLEFVARTSSGTYIRTLAHDLGQSLGVGAYLEELQRLRIGEFSVEAALTVEEIAQRTAGGDWLSVVTPIEALLPEMPKIIVKPGSRDGVLHGRPLAAAEIMKLIDAKKSDYFRLFDDEGKLLAIAKKDPDTLVFRPTIVFSEE